MTQDWPTIPPRCVRFPLRINGLKHRCNFPLHLVANSPRHGGTSGGNAQEDRCHLGRPDGSIHHVSAGVIVDDVENEREDLPPGTP
eukprot:1029688-Rhodomonas_salina.1